MNNILLPRYRYWKEIFESLSLRERALFVISIVAVLYIFWDIALMERIRDQQKESAIQLKKWQKQIASIDGRIQIVTNLISNNKRKNAMQRIDALKSELSDVNQRQKALAVGFIRPKQMVDVLKGLLASERGLQLTRLQSQPVEPLIHHRVTQEANTKTAKQGAEGASQNTTDRNSKPLPEVYKHGLEIVFHGSYNSTLSYLKKLEQLPWKFYWDEVEYEVIEYPKAKIMVRIHTLSLDKGWISV